MFKIVIKRTYFVSWRTTYFLDGYILIQTNGVKLDTNEKLDTVRTIIRRGIRDSGEVENRDINLTSVNCVSWKFVLDKR